MSEIYLIKGANGGFYPDTQADAEIASKLKAGTVYNFKYSKPRNYKFHKKYFSLLNLAYDNQEEYDTFDHFRDAITMQAGHYKTIISIRTGEPCFAPESISFRKMGDIEFDRLYQKTFNVILKYVMVGSTQEEIERVLAYG